MRERRRAWVALLAALVIPARPAAAASADGFGLAAVAYLGTCFAGAPLSIGFNLYHGNRGEKPPDGWLVTGYFSGGLCLTFGAVAIATAPSDKPKTRGWMIGLGIGLLAVGGFAIASAVYGQTRSPPPAGIPVLPFRTFLLPALRF